MSILTRTDVTAVKLCGNYILAGIGSTINVFEKSSLKLLQKVDGLYGQKIYGFVQSNVYHNILVFGGKQFTVLSENYCKEDSGTLFKRQFESVLANDWLHSGVWLDEDVVALLTAHNVVQEWNLSTQTLISQHASQDNSILYSGLLLPLQSEVLVLAGTVFSEVIIHRLGKEKPLHHLKGHKGVIFSITCKPEKHIIVTTSDDRSVRIWGPNVPPSCPSDSIEYWEGIQINCKCEVFGHLARVMRSSIANDIIISVGEDSAICYWDYQGKLLQKTVLHQNSGIWSVVSDDSHLVTGGRDCSIAIHPLSVASNHGLTKTINVSDTTKKIVFTARRNIVVLDANDLVYYDPDTKNDTIHKLSHESTYKLLSVSSCKQLIAVADMNGKFDVFVENCKDTANIINLIDTTLNIGKILSMQWAGNRHIVFCSDSGRISVLAANNNKVDVTANFELPNCKERWLTASAIDSSNNIFIVGDRCGNVHVYAKGQKEPVKSFNKVHGRYGPTSINIQNSNVITTGRDGTIKMFSLVNGKVSLMNSKDIEFQWIEKFLDKDQNLICGFQERVFIVYNLKDNLKLLEVQCGGGHRSWDAVRYFDKQNNTYEEFIKLIYLKNSDINTITFELDKIVSKYIINGSHAKEINCLKAYKTGQFISYMSGGEDTTLRISSVNSEGKFQDNVIFKHLSSIKTIKVFRLEENKIILISAGGRAQICIKYATFTLKGDKVDLITEELVDYQVKGTDKQRKGNQTWRNCTIDFDPETRIMDLDVTKQGDSFIIFAGCSDAYLRVFKYVDGSNKLELIKDSKYHQTCVLKTNCIKVFNKDVLVTCTTRGDVVFWDVTDMGEDDFTPFFHTRTNKSGINSFTSTLLAENSLVIGTGGDDNSIHLVLLEVSEKDNEISMKIQDTWSSDKFHSSQITGLCLVDNYLISTSIDQRITMFSWNVRAGGVVCEYLTQTVTDVADVQGMDLLEQDSTSITVCVFGKGMEVIRIGKPQI